MRNIGLVLEGGGMRGLYSAGVLEYFMEKGLYFPYVIGVSAGACMAASYVSRQKGRNKKINIDLVNDHRYISYRNFIRRRELFGMDFLFDEIPNRIVPFDFETFLTEEAEYVVGTTNCETGEAVYYNKQDHGDDILKIIRASSSLPFIAPIVEYDGNKLLDGGIIDPIPIRKAQQDGFRKNLVIMTKAKGYKKKPSKLAPVVKFATRRYPKLGELLEKRYILYNETLDYLKLEERKANVYIIQPSKEIPVSRLERNQKRLMDLYELGYNDAKNQFDQINKWLMNAEEAEPSPCLEVCNEWSYQ